MVLITSVRKLIREFPCKLSRMYMNWYTKEKKGSIHILGESVLVHFNLGVVPEQYDI